MRRSTESSEINTKTKSGRNILHKRSLAFSWFPVKYGLKVGRSMICDSKTLGNSLSHVKTSAAGFRVDVLPFKNVILPTGSGKTPVLGCNDNRSRQPLHDAELGRFEG